MKRISRMIKTLLEGLVPFAFAVALMEVGEVGAVTLNSGDLLVVDESAFGGSVVDFTEGPHPISTKGTTEIGGAKRRSDFAYLH